MVLKEQIKAHITGLIQTENIDPKNKEHRKAIRETKNRFVNLLGSNQALDGILGLPKATTEKIMQENFR